MARNKYHSPHSPQAVAQKPGPVASTHRPRPLCNRGGRAGVCVVPEASKRSTQKLGEWPPAELALPSLGVLEKLSMADGGEEVAS